MNLSEALTAALPELPARKKQRWPMLDPDLIVREQIEDGEPMMMCYKRRTSNLYRFSPIQWELCQLFDGQRSYKDVADAFAVIGGYQAGEEEMRQFAEGLEESDFWYKSPQERNAALHHRCQEDRRRHIGRKSKYGDVSHMQFSAWDPNEFLARCYEWTRFVYTRRFTTLTLTLFAFTAYVFIANWGEIGRDTLQYYTFTEKSAADLAEFWLLFLVLGFFHESAHGLTCKHYGGNVHSMGFHLIYLTPAFFIDVTEVFVFGGRWQRVMTVLAGIWVEMIFCGAASLVWWASAPGSSIHDFAYKVMLITGVAVIVVNANPLIKLDGYFIFCELLGIAEIKEQSTAFVSQWVKRHLWRLPVEVEYVPRKRRPLFVAYALISGLYSYLLLFAVARFVYHVFLKYSPEWAIIPGLAVAGLIFRSRVLTLVRFMKTVYLDKKERLRAWFTPTRMVVVATVALVALCTPIFTERIEARFLLEPAERATLRSVVEGSVERVYVREGQKVAAGAVVAQMRNLRLESAAAEKHAEMMHARANATQAQLRNANYALADAERVRAINVDAVYQEQVAALTLRAPISGTVVTVRPEDIENSEIKAGTQIAEIADTSSLRARVYVPEFDIGRAQPGQGVALKFDGFFRSGEGKVVSIKPESTEIAAGLIHKENYRGLALPNYYAAEVLVPNAGGDLRDGMSGTAKIAVRRRSLGWFLLREVREFAGRKIW